MPIQPILLPKPPAQRPLPGESDIDRFATLFLPATPPATPTLIDLDSPITEPGTSRSHKSADSDFGAFVSVPPSQDPLSLDAPFTPSQIPSNHSLVYFDRFTSHSKTAAERSRRDVLDELLEHQDDPMYFLDTRSTPPPPLPPISSSSSGTSVPIPISTDDALAEALASDMHNPKLFRVEHSGSVKVAPSPSLSRVPLPPRLSAGSASPPSISSPTDSSTSLPISPPPASTSKTVSAPATSSASHPAQATLSRISSSFVSLLPSGRPRSTAPSTVHSSMASSAPTTYSRLSSPFAGTSLTHGSPFASTPYIPPTGAPGFAGDRAWDRGFSGVNEQEENLGLVDPIGLGLGAETGTGTDATAHGLHGKAKGITLAGRSEGTTRVLNEEMANLIRPHLPALMKLSRHWTLLYSIDQHGISLNTLYTRCEPRIPTRAHPNPLKGGLLVIQDACDAIFGLWLSEGIRLEKGGYYGSGESFLWRYHPSADGERQGEVEVYTWTGKNAYVSLCEPGFLSFGGGDGHYGLYVGSSLLDGSSAPCPTFGNPPLCGQPKSNQGRNGAAKAMADVPFECVGFEVWGVGQAT